MPSLRWSPRDDALIFQDAASPWCASHPSCTSPSFALSHFREHEESRCHVFITRSFLFKMKMKPRTEPVRPQGMALLVSSECESPLPSSSSEKAPNQTPGELIPLWDWKERKRLGLSQPSWSSESCPRW